MDKIPATVLMNKDPDTDCREKPKTQDFLNPRSYSNHHTHPISHNYPLNISIKYKKAENLNEFLCIKIPKFQSLGIFSSFM